MASKYGMKVNGNMSLRGATRKQAPGIGADRQSLPECKFRRNL